MLDNGEFGRLADVLYQDCGWEPVEIRSRLKHYEGWDRHDWAWGPTVTDGLGGPNLARLGPSVTLPGVPLAAP